MSPYTPSLLEISQRVLGAYDTLKPETPEEVHGNQQLVSHLRNWFGSSDRTVSHSGVYSLNRFIDAELDFTTTGNRGLGRMTDDWPRFGGKYREILTATPKDALQLLKLAFCDEIVTGYLFAEYLIECTSNQPVPRIAFPKGHEGIFEQWIPTIYSGYGPPEFDAEFAAEYQKSYYDIKELWGHAPGDVVHGHFTTLGIPVDNFAQQLIRQYFDAGIMLRVAEMRSLSAEERGDIVTGGGYSAAKRAEDNNPTQNAGCLVFLVLLVMFTTTLFAVSVAPESLP